MITRLDLIERLTRVRDLIKTQQCSTAIPTLDESITTVLNFSFFPFLDLFLAARMAANLELDNFASYITDSFIRLSPSVRISNPTAAFGELLPHFDRPLTIELPPEYHNLFPISASVVYDPDRIVAGCKPKIHFSIFSQLRFPIDINSISIALKHDNLPDEEILQISDQISVRKKLKSKFSIERTLPPAIAQETVTTVIYRFQKVNIRVSRHYCPPLHISPDSSACNINWALPNRCIIGADIPLIVTLESTDHRLTQVQIWFVYDSQTPINISGKFGEIEIGRSRANLPDIEPHEKCELKLTVRGGMAVSLSVDMVVSFGTALSGTGKFRTPLQFKFESPFEPRMRCHDATAHELSCHKSLVVEKGSFLLLETSLTNRLESDVALLAIDAPLTEVDVEEFPIQMGPGETFTFTTKLFRPGIVDICVHYESKVVGKCAFHVKSPPIECIDQPLLFSIVVPSVAVRYQKFEAVVTIEKNSNSEDICDIHLVIMEIQGVPAFYVYGPTKKTFSVFTGQKTVIPIRFLPLEAGSTTIPQITFTEVGPDEPKIKRLVSAIVVTYH